MDPMLQGLLADPRNPQQAQPPRPHEPMGGMMPPMQPQSPMGRMQAPAGMQPPRGFQGQVPLNQIYGLLAEHGDPMKAGTEYVNAVQNQQRIDTQNNPMEQYLRLYGNVNPHDFKPQSLSKFHDTLTRTGDFGKAFEQLESRDPLSTKEQGILTEQIEKAQNEERSMMRMTSMADRFESAAQEGIIQGRFAGNINEWFKNMFGAQNDISALRTEFNQLVNTSVINSLPPGVASDRDIALARAGWPEAVDDPQYIADYMRLMQKVSAYNYSQALYRATYLGENRNEEQLMQNWNRDKAWFVPDVFQQFGLTFDRTAQPRAPGTPGSAPGTNIAPGSGAGQPLTEAEIEAKYGL